MRRFPVRLAAAVVAAICGGASAPAVADETEATGASERPPELADTATLVVRVQGLESSDGNLRFVLFDSEENFLARPTRAEIVEISDGQGVWVVDGVAYGTYAVLVHHDLNANGKMERHWYGKPREPTGASNDAPARFGPPKFKDAKFLIDSPTLTISVAVK